MADIVVVPAENPFSVVIAPLRTWRGMIIHSTVVPDRAAGEGRRVGELIDRSHRLHRGFARGMGYHLLINVDGSVEAGARWAQQLPGAHCAGQNSTHIGVAWVGDGDRETPTDAQWAALRTLWMSLAARFRWDATRLYLHREFTSGKTCPGILLSKRTILECIGGCNG